MMTKEDLKEEYRKLKDDEFITLKKHPELAYNLKGEIKELSNNKLLIPQIKINKHGNKIVIVTINRKEIHIFRDIITTLLYEKNKFIFDISEDISWSNIKVVKKFKSTSYTENEVREFIKKNNILTKAQLFRENSKMHSSAKILGLFKDKTLFPQLPLKIDPESRINWIYAYFSKKEKSVYIGRTFSKSRNWDHRNEKNI